jgi:hypothetical protein
MVLRRFAARPGLKKLDIGIRQVSSTYGKAVFLTHANKSTGTIAVESPAERLVSQLLSIDPTVRTFQAQPWTVDLLGQCLLRTPEEKQAARKRATASGYPSRLYTPDFLVGWSLGTQTAVEVKTADFADDALYQQKLDCARSVLWRHGIEFARVVVPSYWRHPLLTNAPLLYQAAARRDLAPDVDVLDAVEALSAEGACTLGQFCIGLSMPMAMAPVLVAHGALCIDAWVHEMRHDTPASPAFGELDHLSLLGRLA